ncbi:MAG: hypothetical protein A2830_03100 [Candidatus Taylorbacteria bacterium RIFCSPHIGHO2_01_FULL_44_110]|uniref:DUF192 domain-containing protein n=1 Tax=Candidatus Taylorbacteria bacterium RIFCSPHIGHO2_12_FULL_45_16 TaxID=1802315 RepID=A0A1G2N0E0_9BACT|nr:MAG: hypothetical protein A2830_03100 [Candidatus Taylorbacteria bacterium RIFCSPHIGHO2_01_FULL_44_110]OHA28671.1 MAG: hypothetical protein A3F51_02755 [Candidatus Taylorbacteria bacterium RIFCSPHIGHO2_12_FULL_45_16]OHA32944.1 MAG: hypothetical protein A3A23_00930 [Candidatus Taylorbacteria bacterium RIFCSPLOWO2_01_FULL_45_59]OHA38435.1 MAG: hypothetical protein A3I98_00435 [Candidatus Taylorbacteria bacterium RIFCSPLOWO2_02_FULL_45_10b]OHA44080.1 MAG: hypothetical protein A3G04_03105 [Candi
MLTQGVNFTMRFIITICAIIIGIGVLWYVARKGMSVDAVPTLQEYVASTTIKISRPVDNQASVAWLASSTILDSLLLGESTVSSAKNVASSTKTTQTITKNTQSDLAVKNTSSLMPIKTPKGIIYAIVAKTPATRQRGLSGHEALDDDQGMLFIFPTPQTPDFWMKDMNFPIDIVWINSDRKIIGVDSDVSQKTYPKTFAPPAEIQFVLEVNAGVAEKLGLKTGIRVVF